MHDAPKILTMRTTLDIDSDVLQVAKDRARHEKKTVGKVISDLARSALTASASTTIYGLRPFPKRGGIVTNELINKLREGEVY
jgi:hypothetical protein